MKDEFDLAEGWASGIPWIYTIWRPSLFFGVQGEFLYAFLILLFVQRMWMLKLILLSLVVVMISGFLGYTIENLFRRWNRWRLSGSRPIYCTNDNIKRMTRGI